MLAAACSSDHGHGDDDGASYNCATEARDDEFLVGIEKVGKSGKLTFKLLEATPAPPARGDNTWVLQLTSQGAAAPVTGAAMIVTPFMPDHQHGTPSQVVIEPMPSAGTYKLAPVNMWMPGLWQTTIQAEANGVSDSAVFSFCIPS
ncbi:MAG TPA: FixH family protein [Kofleriaceae bacterium]|nr:FixH family protein [Kofleriaceae bacterium]